MRSLAFALFAIVSTATLAQTPPPVAAWSEVTGTAAGRTTKERTAAVIRQVDGRYVHETNARIAPGMRDVVVQSPARRGFGGTDRHLRLRAEPCRRYYINVQFRASTGTDWNPVVAKSEPIIGCRLPPA